jgi:hypothetical protein
MVRIRAAGSVFNDFTPSSRASAIKDFLIVPLQSSCFRWFLGGKRRLGFFH